MNDDKQSTIGIIGLGLMGQAFAQRLRGDDFTVLGWNREPGRCIAASSVEEVIEKCGRMLVSLPDSYVVRDVLRPLAFRPGQIILDTSTGSPGHAEALSTELARRGVIYASRHHVL